MLKDAANFCEQKSLQVAAGNVWAARCRVTAGVHGCNGSLYQVSEETGRSGWMWEISGSRLDRTHYGLDERNVQGRDAKKASKFSSLSASSRRDKGRRFRKENLLNGFQLGARFYWRCSGRRPNRCRGLGGRQLAEGVCSSKVVGPQ